VDTPAIQTAEELPPAAEPMRSFVKALSEVPAGVWEYVRMVEETGGPDIVPLQDWEGPLGERRREG